MPTPHSLCCRHSFTGRRPWMSLQRRVRAPIIRRRNVHGPSSRGRPGNFQVREERLPSVTTELGHRIQHGDAVVPEDLAAFAFGLDISRIAEVVVVLPHGDAVLHDMAIVVARCCSRLTTLFLTDQRAQANR